MWFPLVIFSLLFLTACSQYLANEQPQGPDVLDTIRSLDLLPRQPHQVGGGGDRSGGRAQPAVYNGTEPTEAASTSKDTTAVLEARNSTERVGDAFELNFENTPVASVAKVVLGDILKSGYSVDPRVQGTVTLSSVHPVPKGDLLFVLETSLRQSGVVMVREGGIYRLIPLGDAVGAGNADPSGARAEPGYGISVVPLQYVSAPTLVKLLDSFATKPGTVRAENARNLVLIQGSGPERRSAIETVMNFDVDWMRGQSVGIFPLQNSPPEPIITELEKILETGENGVSQNVMKFQPVARLNAVMVVTRKPDLLRTAQKWIKRLDVADLERSSVHVYHVKYGEARQIASVLNNMFVGGGSASLDTPGNQVAPGSGLSATSSGGGLSQSTQSSGSGFGSNRQQSGFGSSTSGGGLGSSQTGGLGTAGNAAAGASLGAAGGGGGLGGGGGGSGQPVLQGVRITPDVVNNSLLIYANQENYQIIERTLNQVDRPPLQVAFDATVAEVTLNDQLNYGVQFYLQSQNLGLKPDQGSLLNTTSTQAPVAAAAGTAVNAFINRAFPGFNFLVGSEANPHVILQALHDVTSVKVLTNPSIVVIDNQVATLQVGDSVPVSTGTANVLNATTSASSTVVNSIDYRNTGIILRVVPRINVNGNVRLDIEQEISQVTPATAASLTPTVSERKVKSSISVASGQTVLLAGLISEQKNGDRQGIPGLDTIEGVSDLFTTTTKTAKRTELIIFIRPQIIRDGSDAHYVAEELRSKLRGTVGTSVDSNGPVSSLR